MKFGVEPRARRTVAGRSSSFPWTVAVGSRRGGDQRETRPPRCYDERTATRALLEHCIERPLLGGVCESTDRCGRCVPRCSEFDAGTAGAELYSHSRARARNVPCVGTTRARSRVFERYWSRP